MACFEFAGHFLDLQQGRLLRGHADISLRSKSFSFLVRNRGRVIGKDEILSAVWPEVTVSDDSLTQCIADIRRTLGPEAKTLIRTVPRRGYILDETQVKIVAPDTLGAMRWNASSLEPSLRPTPRATVLRLVKCAAGEESRAHPGEPAPLIEMAPRRARAPVTTGLACEFRWREEGDGWWQRLAPHSLSLGVSIAAGLALLLSPLIGTDLAFSRGVALLILFAALRTLRMESAPAGIVLALQSAATSSVCLGLSLADEALHLFGDRNFTGTLLVLSVISSCLSILATQVLQGSLPQTLLRLAGTPLLVVAGMAIAVWLARTPVMDPAYVVALAALLLLQLPGIAFGWQRQVRQPANLLGGRRPPAIVSAAIIMPGLSFVMDAHPRQLIP